MLAHAYNLGWDSLGKNKSSSKTWIRFCLKFRNVHDNTVFISARFCIIG